MTPLKILFPVHVFFPSHFYGTETYTLQLAKEVKKLGHFPTILTVTPFGEAGAGKLHSVYHYDGLKVHCIDQNLMPPQSVRDTYYRTEMIPVLTRIIEQVNPDIVHVTHLINHTTALLDVIKKAQIPAVATFTDFFGICLNHKLERYDGSLCTGPNKRSANCIGCHLIRTRMFSQNAFYGRIIKDHRLLKLLSSAIPALTRLKPFKNKDLIMHSLDVMNRIGVLRALYGNYSRIIAPTDFLMEAYARNNFYPEKIKKINFGIELNHQKSICEPKKKTDSHITFGYVGQIIPHKGVDLLIDAFLGLDGNNKTLIIHGPGDQNPEYMLKLKQKADQNSHIQFASTFPKEELATRLRQFDVLVIPSRWYENSPLVLLYGLATRTPVIVSDVRGMNEFVRNGYNGYTFSMGSVSDLMSKMQLIVNEPEIIEQMSKNAKYEMSITDHAQKVLAMHEEVLLERGQV
jgi:glycosyltransferase involved in cell wall biosynthesis